MSKLVKRVFVLSTIFILGVLSFVLFVFFQSSSRIERKYDIPVSQISIPNSAVEIAEGKRIYISRGCSDCHGKDLSGLTFIDDPAIGTFSGSNLTKGQGGIPASYKTEDFERAIRHGVGLNGRALIFMPSTDFHQMTNEDLGRLIAYIQSESPINKAVVPISIGPLARVLFTLGKLPHLVSAELINHSEKLKDKITPEVSAEYGKYIATTCTGCHGDTMVGGPIPGAPPEWPIAQDITSKGIGKWTEAEFIASVRTGKRPDGSEIKAPMPWQNFSLMTDIELKSLYLYLKSM